MNLVPRNPIYVGAEGIRQGGEIGYLVLPGMILLLHKLGDVGLVLLYNLPSLGNERRAPPLYSLALEESR
jgi:hypothetical protein